MRRLLLAFAVLLPLAIPGAAAVRAQQAQPGCTATINGTSVTGHRSADNAITIDPDEPIRLTLTAPQAVGTITVKIEAAGYEREIVADSSRNTQWSGSEDIADEANLGVGLYKATLTSATCELTAWVNIDGNPFTTLAGAAATALTALGLGIQVFGLVRGLRAGGGFKWALLGGIPTGLGLCVLAQQFGVTPLTPRWVATWTTPPIAIGGILQTGIKVLFPGYGDASVPAPPSTNGHGAPGGPGSEPPATGGLEPRWPEPTAAEPPPPPPPSGAPAPVEAPWPEPTASEPPSVDVPADMPGLEEPASRPTRGGARIAESPAAGGAGAGAGSVQAPPAAAEEVRDPPRTTFALLDCPDVAVAGEQFELALGLTGAAQPGVIGAQLLRPATSVGDYVVTIQLVADGFTLAAGESWRHALPVTVEAPHPSVRVHLTPEPQDTAIRPRTVQAMYSVNGHTMGLAVRAVAVVRSADLAAAAPAPEPAEGVALAVPTDVPAADLTVRIQKAASQSGGKLMWTFDTPHTGMDVPDEPVVTDIGDEPENFVRQLITGISVQEGRAGLHAYLSGVGITIADEMPAEFWALFKEVAERAAAESRTPSIFLLSEEPYVPWELSIIDSPVGDPAAARFLGAQACVGRWVLGHRRPTLPPPLTVDVQEMAVISGIYDQPGWNRLLDAEAEAAELCRLYGGRAVDAGPDTVLRCLAGDPTADLLHFSLHGVYDPGSIANGLVLVDGSALDPFQVKGQMLSSSPFVFLNACQVGAGSRLLGDYAGMAEAFLYAGASGVVAPLWSISDTLARGVARRFYEEAFDGTPPSEVLRRERGTFTSNTPSATALAYLYYGHPSLRLKRESPGP